MAIEAEEAEVALGATLTEVEPLQLAKAAELSTPRTIQGGPHHAILTFLLSTRAKSTGPGANPATNATSLPSAHGKSSSLPDPPTETGTSLKTLTSNKFIICCTTLKIKKYK